MAIRARPGHIPLALISIAALALPPTAAAHQPAAGAGDLDVVPLKVERALGGEVTPLANGLYRVESARGYTYTTHGPDFKGAVGPAADPVANIGPGAPERAPVCIANPATDYYQEVLYAYPTTGTNQLAGEKAGIQAQIRRNNALLNQESLASGGGTADFKARCEADSTIRVSAFPVSLGSGTAATFTQVVNAAKAAGYGDGATDTNVDYTIFYDGPSSQNACGVGYVYGDERLIAGNINNNPGNEAGYGVSYGGCWFTRTSMHENAHNQGAVQGSAPNSTGTGRHCNEQDDVMCFVDGGNQNQAMIPCPTNPGTLHYDCSWNTYFDAAPEAGEWLATHWNIGSSLNRFIRFGGPSPGFSYSCAALQCSFTDQSTAAAGVASHSWTFGDGGTSTDPNPSHTYAATGLYEVTLIVTDANGASNLVTRRVSLNDSFADAESLTGSSATATGRSSGATKEAGEPDHHANSGGASVWYRWTAPVSGPAEIDTCGSGFDTLLAVYTGTSVGALIRVASDGDSASCGAGSQQSALSFNATAGETYRIAVDGFNGGSGAANGDVALDLSFDTTAPETTILGGPIGPISDTTPSYSFVASEAGSSFECRFDSEPFAPCSGPSGSHTASTPLGEGPHVFWVRATDPAGNTDASPDERNFSVDTVAPDTQIGSGPIGTITTANTSFSFSAVGIQTSPTSFECRLDSGAFYPCISPTPLSGLGEGDHSFQVRATDTAANTDPSPATRAFAVDYPAPVDRQAPGTSITRMPRPIVKVQKKAKVTFGFRSDDTGAAFQCSLDGAAFTSCVTPRSYARIAIGSHAFRVRSVDAAGNVDLTPARVSFRVKKKK